MSIIYNKARNRAGVEMLKFLNKHGVKTLASINNIKPGQNLMKTLKEEGVDSIFICGDNTIHEWKAGRTGKLRLKTKEGGIEDVKQAFEAGYNIVRLSQRLVDGDLAVMILEVDDFMEGNPLLDKLREDDRFSYFRYLSKKFT